MKRDTRPQSEKIAAATRAQIMAGLLPPGSKLPSIPRLAAEWEVSTATVQNAWQILRTEGYLESETGKGVFVRERSQFAISSVAYFDPVEREVRYEILDVGEVEAPADIAAALGEERAVLRHRLMLHGDERVELSWSYYPATFAVGTPLGERKRIRGGAPRVLDDLGYPERRFVDRVSVRPPTTEEAEMLEIPAGVHVIRQFRTIYSDDEKVVEVTIVVLPGHLYEVSYSVDF
ncbi:GntR family transcriptional regulator [Streptosporangium saharense]|uniref:GntR family transcriptional regulator n=1 Tax=Streptosporangium saharense TaxID=1706840 RepID=UPI003421BD44